MTFPHHITVVIYKTILYNKYIMPEHRQLISELYSNHKNALIAIHMLPHTSP